MSLPYFLSDDPTSGTLEGPEAKHANVKRIQPGERIMLTDGRGTQAEVVVERVGGDRVEGVVDKQTFVELPTPRVTIVQAIPKGERAELAVDLAVQGGADAIVPWISHRTIARWPANKQAKQVAKWRSQAVASAKQARRAWVPEVAEPVTTNQLSEMLPEGSLVLHEDAAVPLRDVELSDDVWLIVGPEGGISDSEIDRFARAGATPTLLGTEILRASSAGPAALAALCAVTGRWQ